VRVHRLLRLDHPRRVDQQRRRRVGERVKVAQARPQAALEALHGRGDAGEVLVELSEAVRAAAVVVVVVAAARGGGSGGGGRR